jgi:hypothetical protein
MRQNRPVIERKFLSLRHLFDLAEGPTQVTGSWQVSLGRRAASSGPEASAGHYCHPEPLPPTTTEASKKENVRGNLASTYAIEKPSTYLTLQRTWKQII